MAIFCTIALLNYFISAQIIFCRSLPNTSTVHWYPVDKFQYISHIRIKVNWIKRKRLKLTKFLQWNMVNKRIVVTILNDVKSRGENFRKIAKHVRDCARCSQRWTLRWVGRVVEFLRVFLTLEFDDTRPNFHIKPNIHHNQTTLT